MMAFWPFLELRGPLRQQNLNDQWDNSWGVGVITTLSPSKLKYYESDTFQYYNGEPPKYSALP